MTTRTALEYSRRKHERIAFLLCIHDESDVYIRISLDGDPKHAQNLYRNSHSGLRPIVVTKRNRQFALAHIRGIEVIKFGFVQTNAPLLSKDIEWSEDDVRAWRDLRLDLLKLRHALIEINRKARGTPRIYDRLRFGEHA